MSMKRAILIKEVQYSNQANILLGMTKMTQVVTTKMVTAHMVNMSVSLMLVHRVESGDYSCVARYPPLVAWIFTLTGSSLGGSLHLPRTGGEY